MRGLACSRLFPEWAGVQDKDKVELAELIAKLNEFFSGVANGDRDGLHHRQDVLHTDRCRDGLALP